MDLIAATWGGIVASVGLMVGGEREWALRLGITAGLFLIGGFVGSARGGRASFRHAVIVTVVAYAIYAVFVGLATIIDRAGGPSAPDLVPGQDGRDWLIVAGCALGFAIVGALIARAMFHPRRRSVYGRR